MVFRLLKYIPRPLYPPIIAIVLVIAGTLNLTLTEKHSLSSTPASAEHQHPEKLRAPAKTSTLTKPNSHLKVHLEQIDNIGNDLGEYYIRGMISSGQDLSGTIDFKWVLPDSMTIITGAEMGSIEPRGSEGPWEVRIRVHYPESQWKKPLVLTAKTQIGGKEVGNAGAFRPAARTQSDEGLLQKSSDEPQPLPEKIFF